MIRKVGYRYRPDLGDLLEALKFKVEGGNMSDYPNVCSDFCLGDIVEIKDMYGEGKEPWNLFSGTNEIFELHDVGDWQQRSRAKYLVTKLSKVGPRNYCRGAGAGSWDGQSSNPVVFNGQQIFSMCTLTYKFRGDPSEAAGKPHYWMHEYHLSQESLGKIGLSSSDYVICRVIKDLSKQCHVKKGKKRVSSSTMEDELPKKKAKKNVSDTSLAQNEAFLGIPNSRVIFDPGCVIEENVEEENAADLNQGYVEGCSLSLVPFMTLDDLPEDCFATSSSQKEDFLEIPDSTESCDPDCVIDENVFVTSSGQKEDFLEIPDSTEICDPDCVIDANVEDANVAGFYSNLLNGLDDTFDEFSDLLGLLNQI